MHTGQTKLMITELPAWYQGSDEKLLYYNIEAQTGNVKGEKLGAFYYDGARIMPERLWKA